MENNNLENGYTEELDFLQPAVQEATAPEQPTEAQPVETKEKVATAPASVTGRPAINENPMGKIKLNKEEEAKTEKIDPSTIKLDFKGNKNLIYVIVLGVILLAIIFLIPMFITKFI